MKSKYQKITMARKVLGLAERATSEEIKLRYRNLLKNWHPDTCEENKATCEEMTAKIVGAYEIIMDYCDHYRFCFSEQEVKLHLSEAEWWVDRFGADPLWGKDSED